MAYSERLAVRLRERLAALPNVREASMFGGRCFMLNDKMLACVSKGEYLFRVGKPCHDEAFERAGVRPMINNGNIMRGFLFVAEDAAETDEDFEYWIGTCLWFNEQLMQSDIAENG